MIIQGTAEVKFFNSDSLFVAEQKHFKAHYVGDDPEAAKEEIRNAIAARCTPCFSVEITSFNYRAGAAGRTAVEGEGTNHGK